MAGTTTILLLPSAFLRRRIVFKKNVVVNRAHLHSHAAPGASEALSVCLSKPEPRHFVRTVILGDSHYLLQVSVARRECGTLAANAGSGIREVTAESKLCGTTQDSGTSCRGAAQPGAARVDGAVCTRGWEDKERKHSEFPREDRSFRCGCIRDGRKIRWLAAKTHHVPFVIFHAAALA